MRLAAGKLKQRISVQEQTTQDINGSRIPGGWTDVYETWCSIKSMRGERKLEYQQLINYKPYDILLRFNDDIPFKDVSNGEIKRKYRIVQKLNRGKTKKIFTIHEIDDGNYQESYEIVAYEKN